MASISSAGIGSGLDVNSIVTQLMTVEKAPLQNMQTEASHIQSKVSAYGKIQSYTSALRDAALALTKADTWGSTTATSGDSSVVSVTTDNTAAAANYSLSVQQLASAQTVASSAWPASVSTVGSGHLRIELGSWANSGPPLFTPKSGSTSADITISATDTLADVRDKINAAKSGVMASIVNDVSGARLVMTSTDTGVENAFRVTATDDDGNNTDTAGLSALAYDPSAGANAMQRTQTAANAKATINGLAVESASNTLTGVVSGVTMQVAKVSTTPVALTISSNTSAIKTAVTAFTDAYNTLNKYLADQTKYDSATKAAGTLQGDSGTNALRSAMRGVVGDTSTVSGAYQRLSQIGIDPQSDGSLKVNGSKLDAALGGHLTDVKALFANTDTTTTSNNGFATRLRQWGDSLLSFDGVLTTRTDSLQRQISANTKKQDDFNNRMTSVEARMRAQYTALDTQMSKMNALSSYVTQQITTMNKSSS